MIERELIKDIIRDGKLKTYQVGPSFIEVYYLHESISEFNAYYLFQFTTASQQLFDVKTVNPRFIPAKERRYAKMIEYLMLGLLG